MRTRLNRGTNQYQEKRHFVNPKAQTNIIVISLLLLPVIIFGHEAAMNKPIELIDPRATRAYAMETEVSNEVEPELAPLSERENSIRIIKKVWKRDWKIGVAIATCESGLRSEAFNGKNNDGTWDAGLFQINKIHGWSKEELMDAVANAGIAYSKFVDQGKQPWYSSQHCWEGKI